MGVLIWWGGLSATGIIGIVLWLFTARSFWRRQGELEGRLYAARRRQLQLSAVYAFGCAFRAMLPRADVQRICLADTVLSSVLIGRTVATLAELSFVIQWALIMREIGTHANARFAALTSRVVVPAIFVAEVCSWYAVITTNFVGNAIEQSLWDLSVVLMTLSLLMELPRFTGPRRKLLLAWTGLGVAFVGFVTFVDVPMYVRRWLADEAAGRAYFGLRDGLHDLATRWVVTYAWEPWKDEIAWMSLYFSAAVWLSVSLVRAPWLGAPHPDPVRTASPVRATSSERTSSAERR